MSWFRRKPAPESLQQADVPPPVQNALLRDFVPDQGACFVLRVGADGSFAGKWLGLTDEQAVEALYSVADAVVAKIPLRRHEIR